MPKKKRPSKSAPVHALWWGMMPSPAYYHFKGRTRKEIKAEAAKEREREAKHRINQAIPGITDLVEQGHLLVTETFMKMVTHRLQKEGLIKAVILGKLKRE